MAQITSMNVPAAWETHAERTQYRETPRYDETLAYARKLAAASPLIRVQSFGKSGQNRELPLIIAATNETFTAQTARSGKSRRTHSSLHTRGRIGREGRWPCFAARHCDYENALSLLDHVVVLLSQFTTRTVTKDSVRITV
jgi:hypothetical protein